MCQDAKVCASTSLTVLDRERGATVELFPDGPGVLEPTDGVLVRTNHFVSEAGRDGCLTPEDVYPSSYLRRRHLERALRARPPGSPTTCWPRCSTTTPRVACAGTPSSSSRRGSAVRPWPRSWSSPACRRCG